MCSLAGRLPHLPTAGGLRFRFLEIAQQGPELLHCCELAWALVVPKGFRILPPGLAVKPVRAIGTPSSKNGAAGPAALAKRRIAGRLAVLTDSQHMQFAPDTDNKERPQRWMHWTK